MRRMAHLRGVLASDREPRHALFTTYGFDVRFFESELLPLVFPDSLRADRESGTPSSYLNAADTTMMRHQVEVFYDHLADEGPELVYDQWPVDARPGRFHPKLILLDYGDRVRAVIGSANLTRPAWTTLLELFVVEDLTHGESHPWAAGLRAFLRRLDDVRSVDRLPGRASAASILDDVTDDDRAASDIVTSSWDGPLLDRLLDGVEPDAVDVVTPFLEGAEGGPGVFEELSAVVPGAKRLFVSAPIGNEGRPTVRGPREKIEEAVHEHAWAVHGVEAQWPGDDEDAPAFRALHGKAVVARSGRYAKVMIGSANATRRGLLLPAGRPGAPGVGNVELVVLRHTSAGAAASILPVATELTLDEFDIDEAADPDGEDDDVAQGLEHHVARAEVSVAAATLTVELADDAPALEVFYDGSSLGTFEPGVGKIPFALGRPVYVEVRDGDDRAVVPLTVLDPQVMVPRGTRRDLGLFDLLDALAGGRDLPEVEGDRPTGNIAASDDPSAAGLMGQDAGLPWRRLFAALRGLADELAREAHDPRALAFVLDSPVRLGGLIQQLEATSQNDQARFTPADLHYALYELERCVASTPTPENPRCVEQLKAARDGLRARQNAIAGSGSGTVRRQIAALRRLDGRSQT